MAFVGRHHGASRWGPLMLGASRAWAEDAPAPAIDTGDTAWMLTSSALVLMMTAPGLALFYGGLVRQQERPQPAAELRPDGADQRAVGALGLHASRSGRTSAASSAASRTLGLAGVGVEPAPLAPTIPHLLFMMYQMMFAIITPALITGAFAERMKFSAFLVFSLLWATLVYDPLAHWVWGGGLIGAELGRARLRRRHGGAHQLGHLGAGRARIVIGKRLGYGSDPMPPHNLPFTVIGAALLWFGWFGFNAGSALAANGLAAIAFVATNTATAAATLSWMLAEWLSRGKPTVLGAASGAVAGLVAITPASGFVTPDGVARDRRRSPACSATRRAT